MCVEGGGGLEEREHKSIVLGNSATCVGPEDRLCPKEHNVRNTEKGNCCNSKERNKVFRKEHTNFLQIQ